MAMLLKIFAWNIGLSELLLYFQRKLQSDGPGATK